jgi:hypothetical protein
MWPSMMTFKDDVGSSILWKMNSSTHTKLHNKEEIKASMPTKMKTIKLNINEEICLQHNYNKVT